MRTTLLIIVFALMAGCATADVIDNAVANLPDGWSDNVPGLVILPKAASTEDVLQNVFQKVTVFDLGLITNFTILETRSVQIPCSHFRNAPTYSYTAVLVQPGQSEKVVIVFLRDFDVYDSKAWTSAFFEAKIEDTWKTIENDFFSFSAPPSFKRTTICGIDSFVEEYVSNGIDLIFDYDYLPNNFNDWPEGEKFEDVKIDGRAARIVTVAHEFRKGFPYSTQFHIQPGTLNVYAYCKSEKEVALARRIFETITFNTEIQ
jgi:hypothetical protein